MREYELMAVYDLAVIEEGGENASVQHLTSIVERNAGEVTEVDHWGRRRLAYPINKQLDADFIVTKIQLDPQAVAPLNADFELEERVFRHMVVRADELPPPRPVLAPAGPRGPGSPTGPSADSAPQVADAPTPALPDDTEAEIPPETEAIPAIEAESDTPVAEPETSPATAEDPPVAETETPPSAEEKSPSSPEEEATPLTEPTTEEAEPAAEDETAKE